MKIKLISLVIIVSITYNVDGIDTKGCHFNDSIFNKNVFINHACYKCYESFSDRNRLQKVYCLVEHDAFNFTVPGFVYGQKCISFDHRSASISTLVQSSLTNETFHLWAKCCRDALNCCRQMIDNYQVENFFNLCDAHWDGLNCFSQTYPGDFVKKSCPFHIVKNDESKCNHTYNKQCQLNGSWTNSDFSKCYQNERMTKFSIWHIVLLSISMLFCLLPLVAYGIDKIFIGKHSKILISLIVFLLLRNSLSLISFCLIFNNSNVLTINALACRLMTMFKHFFDNMTCVCIAMAALKLVQIMKSSTENWGVFILMSIGLILAIASTVTWSLMMKIYSNKFCWILDNEGLIHLINDGMKLIMLMTAIILILYSFIQRKKIGDFNTFFLLKIFIVPVITFLLPFIFILISSLTEVCHWEDYYKLMMTFFEFLQTIAVCIILFLPPIVNLPKLKNFWSTTKISSQNSNASLAPSRLSYNEPLNSWHDVVACAKSSCHENVLENESVTTTISTIPEPYKNDDNGSLKNLRLSDSSKRHKLSIRQVMLRAKSNLPHLDEIHPRKCSTPPIPKIIPSIILDDLQLFDFYYKNLDSIHIPNGTDNLQKN